MNVEAIGRSTTMQTAVARPSTMIEITRVEKIFTTVRQERIHALNDISFSVGEREFVTIVGPSGCGKTTLLKILAGLQRSSAGSVTVAGTPVMAPRRDIGIVFQNPILLPWRTVMENVLLPAEVQGIPRDQGARPRARSARHGRPLRFREQIPDGAVRRHAATRRHQPRAWCTIRASC